MFASSRDSDTTQEILHELPWSIGLISPIIFNRKINQFHISCRSPEWYKNAFANAYEQTKSYKPIIKIHKRRNTKDIWFVNCLMPYYGDCVSLLLRTTPLINGPRDLVALVPSALVRMVPDWYSEVWEVTSSAHNGHQASLDWNPEFNNLIKKEFERFNSVAIPHLFQPACPDSLLINDFLGTKPFELSQWAKNKPCVTFLWREDRLSPPEISLSPLQAKILKIMGMLRLVNSILRIVNLRRYRNFIINVSYKLLEKVPNCNINIIGKGCFPSIPKNLNDLRVVSHSQKSDQEDECIASESHVLVSSHGSHLVALSALPGCVIQLVPSFKWTNFLDAFSMRDRDKGGWINYLSVPSDISSDSLAKILISKLEHGLTFNIAYSKIYSGLCTVESIVHLRNDLF